LASDPLLSCPVLCRTPFPGRVKTVKRGTKVANALVAAHPDPSTPLWMYRKAGYSRLNRTFLADATLTAAQSAA